MTRIEAIESVGPDRKARRLLLTSGEERTTAASVVRALKLEPGGELDLSERFEAEESRQARERALRLLRYRERSCGELRSRLVHDGYPPATVETIVTDMERLALVDDERFAALWVRTRCRAGYGRSRIARELAERRVPTDVAERTLDEACPAEQEVDRARASLGGRPPSSRSDRERTVRRLVSKGYDLQVALKALEEPAD